MRELTDIEQWRYTNRLCIVCETDISHKRAGTKFCCEKHKNDWNYAGRSAVQIIRSIGTDESILAELRIGNDLKRRANELLEMLLDRPANPVQVNVQQNAIAAPQQRQLSAPDHGGDFEIEMKKAGTDENNRSDWNFIISSSINVYGTCNSLPQDVIDYGVRTGRIQPEYLTKKASVKSKKGEVKKLKVPEIKITETNFDDIEL